MVNLSRISYSTEEVAPKIQLSVTDDTVAGPDLDAAIR